MQEDVRQWCEVRSLLVGIKERAERPFSCLLVKSLQRVDSGERVGVAVDPRSSIKPWIARIRTDGKSTYIGAYASECEAQAAYRTRLVELIEFYQASESLVVAEAQTSADR